MPQSKPRNSAIANKSKAARSLTCGQVMCSPNVLNRDASVADALDRITSRDLSLIHI